MLTFTSDSNNSFEDLFDNLYGGNEFQNLSGGNFISENIHDELSQSSEIIVILFNRTNKTVAEVRFRGVNHFSNWFRAENIISSYPWALTQTSKSANFSFGYSNGRFRFSILESDNNSSRPDPRKEKNIYMKIKYFHCQSNGNENQTKSSCIHYSPTEKALSEEYSNEASYILIIGKPSVFNDLQLVFRYTTGTVFSSLENFFFGYNTALKKTYDNNLFRSLNMEQEILASHRITIASYVAEEDVWTTLNFYWFWDKILTFSDVFERIQLEGPMVEIYRTPLVKLFTYTSGCGILFRPFYNSGKIESIGHANLPEKFDHDTAFRHYDFTKIKSTRSNGIKFLLFDDKEIVQQILFHNSDKNSWFSLQNVIATSSWNLSRVQNMKFEDIDRKYTDEQFFSVFYGGDICNSDKGFMSGSCGDLCPRDKNFMQEECIILYTSKYGGDLAENFRLATKVELYLIQQHSPKNWQTVFWVDAFCGVDVHKYFQKGTAVPAHDGIRNLDHSRFFRDPNLQGKMENSDVMKLLVYDFDGEDIVVDLHLSKGSIAYASHWPTEMYFQFGKYIDGIFSSFFSLTASDDRISCETLSWCTAVSVNKSNITAENCTLKNWWNHPQVMERNMQEAVKLRPPAFFYTDGEKPERTEDMKMSGKIEIQVTIDRF